VIVSSGPNPPTGNSDAASCGTCDYEVLTERSQRRQTAIPHRAFWGLRPGGPGRWEGGRFYNPDGGETYGISAELRSSPDVFVARIYRGIPLLGETKTLLRVPRGTSAGWC
jgi:hypothetical protein